MFEKTKPALAALLEALVNVPVWAAVAAVIVAALAFGSAVCLARLSAASARIDRSLAAARSAFRSKLGKIPALVMALRDHLYVPDEVFKTAVALYSDAVLRDLDDPYSLLEANGRIHHEIQFIFTVANKHHKVNLDGNFLYVRDFLIEHEAELKAAVRELAAATLLRNRMYRWKNLLLAGLPFPPYSPLPEIGS